MDDTLSGLELRSTATGDGELRIELTAVTHGPPGPDEVIVRVEASPINPSDLGLLFGPATMTTLRRGGTAERPTLAADIPPRALASVQARLDQSLPVGNEGAGTVVAAGADVADLLGRTVGMLGGGMYTQLRKLKAQDCVVLPPGASVADAASMFINPLTALGFVETAKAEGHKAIVHTAAASNLGQMLNRIGQKDGMEIVNIVRSAAQADILRALGATHVLDSTADDHEAALVDAIAATGATIAFDAIGGGNHAARILSAMETAAGRDPSRPYSRYGSDTFKQVYIYGALDLSPTVLDRWVGFSWSVGGWLLTPFLMKAGAETRARLRQRVVDELTTTFASHYTRTIGLTDMLDPQVAAAYQRKATGEKYLLNPNA